jgi:SNF2 family DNA or RNA helicase
VPAILTKQEDALLLNLSGCRGSEFHDAKEKIKAVPGRRWDPKNKVWTVPADAQNADRILKTIRPDADEDLLNWIRAEMSSHEESLTSPLPDDAELMVPWSCERCEWQPEVVNDEKFNGALPWQRAAIDKMADTGRAILADDMGLGKTFEAITAVEEWKLRQFAQSKANSVDEFDGPKLVICPASVKGGWERELRRWLPPGTPIHVIEGSYPKTKSQTAEERRTEAIKAGIDSNGWVIINWEQLRIEKVRVATRNGGRRTVTTMKEPLFEEADWLAVIADEAHRAKNKDAKQTQGLWRVTGKVMFALTGTPIMNSPDELWSILRWLWPEEYHELGARKNAVPYWGFYEDFVDYYEDHFKRKVITGVKNPDALRFILKDKLIRRTADILGLKGRKRIIYPTKLNPGQQALYDEAERAMWLAVEADVAEGNKEAIAFAKAAVEAGDIANLIRIPNGAARLVRLRQIIENAALLGGKDDSAVMDDFEEKFIDSGRQQWVVFCAFKESCHLLAERLRKKFGAEVGVYTGDQKPHERTELEDSFQRGEIEVMVGTIDAMYQGITLTAGRHQHWLSRSYVPAHNEQGESRSDRLGQQHLVLIYIPQPEATVSSGKVDIINRLKESIVRTVLPQVKIKEVVSP